MTYELRHNRSYWVSIDQLENYAERAKLDARRMDERQVVVTTENVQALSLGPIAEANSVRVTIDGQDAAEADLTGRTTFQREPGGTWHVLQHGQGGNQHS